jgi:hypothetical protein
VGAGAFCCELEAVGDAEAVLFVDDDEGEFREIDIGLIEGLCAGEDLDLSGADIVEDGFAPGAFVAAGQGGDADAEGARKRPMASACWRARTSVGDISAVMPPIGCDLRGGESGDEGFAGADVALNHAAHRDRAAHVDGDIGVGVHLGAGGLEGQRFDDVAFDADGARDGAGEAAFAGEAGLAHGHLAGEGFVVGEALAGDFEAFGIVDFWLVKAEQGLLEGGPVVSLHQVGVDPFVEIGDALRAPRP